MAAVIAFAFIGVVRLLRYAGRWWVNAHARAKAYGVKDAPGDPTLLYFWSASCAQCKVQESQILEAQKVLADRGRTITVTKHNAVAEEELSRKMQVLTVPTTVLLKGDGSVAAWNPGLTGSRTLAAQISAVFEDTPGVSVQLAR